MKTFLQDVYALDCNQVIYNLNDNYHKRYGRYEPPQSFPILLEDEAFAKSCLKRRTHFFQFILGVEDV